MTRDTALRLLNLDETADADAIRDALQQKHASVFARLSQTREADDRARILQHIDALNRAQQVLTSQGGGNDPTVMLRTGPQAQEQAADTGTRMFAGPQPTPMPRSAPSAGSGVIAYAATTPQGAPDPGPGLHRTEGFGPQGVPTTKAPTSGDVLLDRYELRDKVGSGGMGEVYAAWDRVRAELIAIKLMLPGVMSQPGFLERFLGEARLSSRLSHEHLIRVFDVQHVAGWYFLTMELLDGTTLRDVLATRFCAGGAFSIDEVFRILEPMVEALTYVHRTSIHRDIKPENVFVCRNGAIKLMDFGTARDVNADRMTATGSVIGTVAYMAPEQWQTPESLDARLDQYAVGAVVFELFAGQPPLMKRQTLTELRPDLPAHLTAAVDRALHPDRDRRHTDCAAFLAACRAPAVPQIAAPVRPQQRRTTVVPEAHVEDVDYADPPVQRRGIGRVVGAITLLLALLGAGAFVATRQPAELAQARLEADGAYAALQAAGAEGLPGFAAAGEALERARAADRPLHYAQALEGYREVISAGEALQAWADEASTGLDQADRLFADAALRWQGVVSLRPGLAALPQRHGIATLSPGDAPWSTLGPELVDERRNDAQSLAAMTDAVLAGIAVDTTLRGASDALVAQAAAEREPAPTPVAAPRHEPVPRPPEPSPTPAPEPAEPPTEPDVVEPQTEPIAEPERAAPSRAACLNACDMERNAGGDNGQWRRCRGACPR